MNRPDKRTRPLPADGLDRALREGRRRRHRAVGTAGGGVTAVLVLVVGLSLLGGSAGSQSLDTADDPTPTASASASASATPEPSGEPTSRPSGDPGPGPESSASEDPDCVNNDCEEQDEGSTEGYQCIYDDACDGVRADDRPLYTETPQEGVDNITCYNAGGPQPVVDGAICQDVTGPDTVRRGEDLVVTVKVCAASNAAGPVTLTFPGGGEQDLAVLPDGGADEPEALWTFAESVRFTGGAHERTLLPRQCLVYSRTWPTAYQDGTPVPAGMYQLATFSLATARNGTPWSRDDQSLTTYPVEVVD